MTTLVKTTQDGRKLEVIGLAICLDGKLEAFELARSCTSMAAFTPSGRPLSPNPGHSGRQSGSRLELCGIGGWRAHGPSGYARCSGR